MDRKNTFVWMTLLAAMLSSVGPASCESPIIIPDTDTFVLELGGQSHKTAVPNPKTGDTHD